MKRAVFFDLQGTLGGEPLGDIMDFSFYPMAKEAVALAKQYDLMVFIVTNQSHISKGLLTLEQFNWQMSAVIGEIEVAGGAVDEVYCCPHLMMEGCICKKPSPYFMKLAAEKYGLTLENCYVVGDIGRSDMLMAYHTGAKGVLVRTGEGEASLTAKRETWQQYTPAYIADDALDAVQWIISDIYRQKDRTVE